MPPQALRKLIGIRDPTATKLGESESNRELVQRRENEVGTFCPANRDTLMFAIIPRSDVFIRPEVLHQHPESVRFDGKLHPSNDGNIAINGA